MIKTPNLYFLVTGSSESRTELNVFDAALLAAGIGDTNLVKMSSILPPGAIRIKPCKLPGGALVPLAYAYKYCAIKGKKIAAAVAVGIPLDPSQPGLIMEHSGYGSIEHIEKKVREMVSIGFEHRKRKLKEIQSIGLEHIVKIKGGVFSAVVLWGK